MIAALLPPRHISLVVEVLHTYVTHFHDGVYSFPTLRSPTLSLLIEHHMWVGTEQEIMHRFDVLSKQYTRVITFTVYSCDIYTAPSLVYNDMYAHLIFITERTTFFWHPRCNAGFEAKDCHFPQGRILSHPWRGTHSQHDGGVEKWS